MKTVYQKPTMIIVPLRQRNKLLAGSPIGELPDGQNATKEDWY